MSDYLTTAIKERFSKEPGYEDRVAFLFTLVFGTSCIPKNVEAYIDSRLSGSWSIAA